MKTRRATTRAERKAKKRASLPARFTPKFLSGCDRRQSAIKEIQRRINELQDDAGADSMQKKLLVERAVFISTRLQSMELDVYEGKPIDDGVHTQMTNCLIGLLKALGLDRKAAGPVQDLASYVEGLSKKKK